MTTAPMTIVWLTLVSLHLLTASVAAQSGGAARPERAPGRTDLVEVAPIRCWWRTSTGTVRIGEPFDVRVTCAVLENETVQVVPDETRLSAAGVQLPPFEIVGSAHPADTRAGQRRFFQYRYTLRLVEPDEIGQDLSLPRLPITYKVQSRVAQDARLTGRDFVYMMPGLPLRVASLVPEDAADIRDGSDIGLERIEALLFRARAADLLALALAAGGILVSVLALVAVIGGARPAGTRAGARMSDRRMLVAVDAELARIAGDASGGWTPALMSDGHAALRVAAALALGRGVSHQPLPPGASPPEGRLAVRAWLPWRPGTAIASATTAADLARELAAWPAAAPSHERFGLEAIRDALSTVTSARYAEGDCSPDEAALTRAIEAGRRETGRLARARRWQWVTSAWPRPRPAKAAES